MFLFNWCKSSLVIAALWTVRLWEVLFAYW